MKILYIITKSNWGGAQRHVFDLASHAKKNGQDVVVAIGGEGMLRDKLREASIATRSIGSLRRDIKLTDEFISLRDIYKIIKSEKPDILHLHSPKAGGLGAVAGRLRGVKKIVFTVHGWAFNEDRPLYQKVLIGFFSWLIMLFSTHVITLSEKETGQTQMFPLVSSKIRMVPLGISPPIFFGTTSARLFFQSKIGEPLEKKIVLGTISELHPNKGLIYAINAFAEVIQKFPTLIFFIIGNGQQQASLEALIKEKGLEKKVILLGYVENAAEYLKAFNIFMLPSVKEGLPYALIEAGYASLPVLATAVGGIPEIIDDMKSGVLIQPRKSSEIAHALEFLLSHKNIQREYGHNLHEKVKAKFNIEAMLVKNMQIYSEPSTHR